MGRRSLGFQQPAKKKKVSVKIPTKVGIFLMTVSAPEKRHEFNFVKSRNNSNSVKGGGMDNFNMNG